jgi:hypothetical protein
VGAAIAEAQAGAGNKVLDSARYQDLARAGERGHASANVNSDTADIVADHFALASMQPGADLDAERPDFIGNGARTFGVYSITSSAVARSHYHAVVRAARLSCSASQMPIGKRPV